MQQHLAAVVALVVAFFFQYVKAEGNTSIKATNATQLAVHSSEATNATKVAVHSSEATPLQIADAVVHAVELAEHGSGKLLASMRAVVAQSAPQGGNPKASQSEEMMDKIVNLMRVLRPLAGRLRTEARSEIEHLRADAARQESLSELAESRLGTMKRDQDRLQMLFQDEMQKGHKCFEQLTESQRLLTAKLNESAKVWHLRKEVEKAHAVARNATQAAEDQRARMEVEIADSRIETARVREQLKAMHEQVSMLTRQNSRLIEVGRNWASRVEKADEELHHFNVTRQAYEVKLAELSDKLGELQEQHEDQLDETKQLESSNEILKEDDQARVRTVTKLQKELDAASEDKVHLLDSIRSLIHQNDELKSQTSRPQPTPVVAKNTEVAKVQKPASAAAGDAAAADWHEFDEIAWMDRTGKIDNYLSGLSDEEKAVAEEKEAEQKEKQRQRYLKAHRGPPLPLTRYLGAEFLPTPAEAKALQDVNMGLAKGGAVAESKPAPVVTPVTGSKLTTKTDIDSNLERANSITPVLRDPRPRHKATDSHEAKKITPQIASAGAVLRGARRVPKWAEAMKNQSQALEDDAFQDLTEAAKLLESVS